MHRSPHTCHNDVAVLEVKLEQDVHAHVCICMHRSPHTCHNDVAVLEVKLEQELISILE